MDAQQETAMMTKKRKGCTKTGFAKPLRRTSLHSDECLWSPGEPPASRTEKEKQSQKSSEQKESRTRNETKKKGSPWEEK